MSKSRRTSKPRSQSVEDIRVALDEVRAAIEQLPAPEQMKLWRTLPYVQTLEHFCCGIPGFMAVVDELQHKLRHKDEERIALEKRVRQAKDDGKTRKTIAKAEGISLETVDSILYDKKKQQRRRRRVEHHDQEDGLGGSIRTSTYHLD
jgi:hypothetical protein